MEIGNRRGVALLITLAVTTVLVAAGLEYNRRGRYALVASAAARNELSMSQMAVSGVHVAMAILAKDRADNDTDTLMDDWANPLAIEEVLREFPFEEGRISVVIADEMAKIQVNALVNYPDSRQFNEAQRSLWERFLQYYSDRKDLNFELKNDSEPQAIINSLKDWLDSGDDDAITGLSGAETSYYQGRKPPYAAHNSPLLDLNELLLVKGVTPELFYGTMEVPGISRYLTIFGMAPGEGTGFNFSGRINISTAEIPVLFALLPAENQDLAEIIDEVRRDIAAGKQKVDMRDPAWLNQISGLAEIKLDPNAARCRNLGGGCFAAGAGSPDGQMDLPHRELAGELA